jgi:hypothetical protein
MRKIDLEKIKAELSDDWLDGAKDHLKAIKDKTPEKKKEYISAKSPFWGKDLRRIFWKFGHKKCWYSEKLLSFNESELEHFRPKNNVAKSVHQGYWWLAFDWRNYRIASSVVNKRTEDDRNREVQGKGTYFPLVDERERQFDYVPSRRDILSIGKEKPTLLDPADGYDVSLLGFDFLEGMYEGRIVAETDACESDYDVNRVKRSIKFYQLNDGNLIDNRFAKFSEFEISCEVLEKLTEKKLIGDLSEDDKAYWKKHYDILTTLVSPGAEYSTMCRAALEDLGPRGWTKRILRTA